MFDRYDRERLRVEVDSIENAAGWRPAGGSVIVWVYRDTDVAIGNQVVLRGLLAVPTASDVLSPVGYLRSRDVSGLISSATIISRSPAQADFRGWLSQVRAGASRILDRYLPQPAAGLARGILLGERGGLNRDLRDSFSRTGLAHLIAISELNMVLVSGLIIGPARRVLGTNYGVAAAAAAIVFYALLVVPTPSVHRAAVMGVAVILADRLGRPADGLTLLALSGAGMTYLRPTLIHDVGFQLSFAATARIILIGPSIFRHLSPLPRIVSHQLSAGLAASWLTFPIIAGTFGTFSPWTALVGIVAVPLLRYIIIGSAALVVAGSIWDLAGNVAAAFALIPLTLLIETVEFVDLHTASFGSAGSTATSAAAYYLLIAPLAVLLIPDLRDRWPIYQIAVMWRRLPTLPTLARLTLVAAVIWIAAVQSNAHRSTVTLLSHRGDPAAIINSSNGRVVIYGKANQELIDAISRRLPIWRRTIDLLIVDQWDPAALPHYRIAGQRYDIMNVMIPIEPPAASEAGEWLDTLRNKGAKIMEAETGLAIQLADGEVLTVLAGPLLDRPVIGAIQVNHGTVLISMLYDSAAAGQLLRTAPYLKSHILHTSELDAR